MLYPFVILSSVQVTGEGSVALMHLLNIRGKRSGSFAEILGYRWLCTLHRVVSSPAAHLSALMEYYPVQPLSIKPRCFIVFLNKIVMRTGELVELYFFFISFLLRN